MTALFDTVREALNTCMGLDKALTALTAIEADHYSAADMADAQAKAFREGVASVTAGQEPVGWFEPPHGAFRANPMLKIQFPPSTLNWQIPVYTAAPVAQQQAEAVPSDVVRDAERLDWLLMQVSGKEFRRIGVEYSGNCQRSDIDAAIAQQKGGVA